VDAYAAREDDNSGPAKWTIRNGLTLDKGNFALFLNQRKLECLTLFNIWLDSVDICRAVLEAKVQIFDLQGCSLADGGTALVESVMEGRGPREIRLARWS
jgi:hypothetical protein